MEGSVLSFLKEDWKVSDTGSAHGASSFIIALKEVPRGQAGHPREGPMKNTKYQQYYKFQSEKKTPLKIKTEFWLFTPISINLGLTFMDCIHSFTVLHVKSSV